MADRTERARRLAALGDPTRLGIMELLAVQDLSPDALVAALEVPGNLLAHHLKVLASAGLITRVPSQHDRRRTYVQAVEGALTGLLPGGSTHDASRVLFVCTHNSARSILAEALWREASDVPVASAGAHPADRINPRATRAAERFGLTIDKESPEEIADVLREDDVVVSVCDAVNEELRGLSNEHLHWSIPDPAAVGTDAAFTVAVEQLRKRVHQLAPRIRPHSSPSTRKAHR